MDDFVSSNFYTFAVASEKEEEEEEEAEDDDDDDEIINVFLVFTIFQAKKAVCG